MNPASEWLDVVDAADRVIGRLPRAVVHARKLRHRAVHILLFSPAGALYLQQRAATKDSFPLCLDSSASGHVDSGEDYDAAAVRELEEELGLTVPARAWEPLFRLAASDQTGQEFTRVYRLRGPYTPRPNPAEIVAGSFRNPAAIATDLARHPERYAGSFQAVFAALSQRQ